MCLPYFPKTIFNGKISIVKSSTEKKRVLLPSCSRKIIAKMYEKKNYLILIKLCHELSLRSFNKYFYLKLIFASYFFPWHGVCFLSRSMRIMMFFFPLFWIQMIGYKNSNGLEEIYCGS
jgi:hypothetical protein